MGLFFSCFVLCWFVMSHLDFGDKFGFFCLFLLHDDSFWFSSQNWFVLFGMPYFGFHYIGLFSQILVL